MIEAEALLVARAVCRGQPIRTRRRWAEGEGAGEPSAFAAFDVIGPGAANVAEAHQPLLRAAETVAMS
ncbi:hypothetical protein WME90_11630 [Sorangium sp. So ce375]|uniref:hypothetical protein n=1 Tax=Sorangium sp. So ce375 TaxID=3133306 RepID=UPI003F5B2385